MTLQEILLVGLPILIGAFGLGLYWILEHELNRPTSLDASSSKSKDKLSDDSEA